MATQPRADARDALGFGVSDPWPAEAAQLRRPPRKPGRAITIAVGSIAGALALLTAIQLFMWWFAPCVKGAC